MNQPNNDLNLSLFDTLRATLGTQAKPILCNKITLVQLSHTLEDIVLKHRMPALMFTGFQESSHWAEETARYRELAQVAQQVCVFGGKPLPEDSALGVVQVTLRGDDPLRQEWFVLILSEMFNVLLCGKDQHIATADALRLFETLLSFEPKVLVQTLDTLEGVLQSYKPALLPQLREARARWGVHSTDPAHIAAILRAIVSFEAQLNEQLYTTQQKRREAIQQLEHERDLNALILQSSGVLLGIVDIATGNLVRINDAAIQLFGALDAVPTDKLIQSTVHPDDQDKVAQFYKRFVEARQPERIMVRMIDKEGKTCHVDWHVHYLEDPETHQPYMVSVGVDVSDRVRAQEKLLTEESLRVELQKEREMNDVRLNFMVTIGHEFRTPLATILTNVELMERHFGKLSHEDARARLRKIGAQVAHMTKMLDEFQLLLEASRQQLVFAPITADVVEQVTTMVQDARAARNATHDVRFAAVGWESEREIKVDIMLLRLIVNNLVGNAIKFSPPDKPIDVTLTRGDETFTLVVKDEGIGIPKKEQRRVFQPFYRATNAAKVSGTGLGLALVQDAVKLYKGKIAVHSDDNGTTFTVTLPLLPQTAKEQLC